jgi:DNA polymerase bacteriophage-type
VSILIWLDCETFSATPINNGTYRYAEDAEVMVITWTVDDGPVRTWDVTEGQPLPGDLAYLLHDTDEPVTAHNAMFDRTVLRYALGIDIALHRWRCTMAQALAHSLPGGLDKVCAVLNVAFEDSKQDGTALIQLFCKPRPKTSKVVRATRHTNPKEWAQFLSYAGADILAMRAVARKLPTWNYKGDELALWHLDQRINDRGVYIDAEFATAAIKAAETAKNLLVQRITTATNGEVASATQRDALLLHILKDYGVDLPDMQASTLERRINDPDLPPELRDILDIRLQASMGSTSKYKAMLQAVNVDGRVRGLLQFNGAARTGRWAGRKVQPQNMFRPPKYIKENWEQSIQIIRLGVADLFFDNVMEATAATARGALLAAPGHKFVVADLANIEGRVQAWLVGEDWKLQAFRDYDAGSGPDLYKLAYAKAFKVDPDDVDDGQRQIGKVLELMLGYGGGVGAFITGALTYGFDVESLAENIYNDLPLDELEEAKGFLEWTQKKKRSTFGLSDRAFTTCDTLKRLWRNAHPEISGYWRELEDAVRQAVDQPGTTVQCRRIKVRRDGGWLRLGLPSGRALCYPSPQVSESGTISYTGNNQYTRKWTRLTTYGGKLFENVCQAVARDVMAANMPLVDSAGYEIVLTVHDELVTEAPDEPAYNADSLSRLLAAIPTWAEGMPLAAAGWQGLRYKKD